KGELTPYVYHSLSDGHPDGFRNAISPCPSLMRPLGLFLDLERTLGSIWIEPVHRPPSRKLCKPIGGERPLHYVSPVRLAYGGDKKVVAFVSRLLGIHDHSQGHVAALV